MPEPRVTSESAPPRTDRPVRQIVVFLLSTYVIAVAIALALPHAGITPLLSIAAPVLGFAITMAVAVPRGQRRAVLARCRVSSATGPRPADRCRRTGADRNRELQHRRRVRGRSLPRPWRHLGQRRSQHPRWLGRLYVCLPRRGDRLAGVSAVSPGRGHLRAQVRPSSPASSMASSICRYSCSPPPIRALVNAGSWCRW